MFDRKHEVWVFLFLLEASLKGWFSLLSNLYRGLSQLTEQALTEQALLYAESLAKCCLLKRANQGNKIDSVFNKCSIESCGEFKSEGLSSLN